MSSSNANKRKKAMIRLSKMFIEEVDSEVIEELIRASADVHHDNENYSDDCSVAIMNFVSQYDLSEFYDVIEEVFPKMSVWARSYSLTILSQVPTKESLTTLLKLLHSYTGNIPIFDFNLDENSISKEAVDVLFPDLLSYTDEPSYSYSIYHFTLQCLRENLLSSSDVMHHRDTLVEKIIQLKTVIEEYQDLFDDQTIWDDPIYMDLRHTVGLYLDFAGYFNSDDEITEILTGCLGLTDKKLQYFSALSLLRFGHDIPNEVFASIGSSPELRCFLFEHLNLLGAIHLFPEEFKSQEYLAESNLVQWLTYPTELGRTPDDIELMEMISATDEQGEEIEYYIFRFRSSHPEWIERGWMAGVSGYYIKKDTPTIDAYKCTFSHFEPWDSKTPEEHLDNVIQTMNEYWSSNSVNEQEEE
jgi:hypothetical protein